MALRRESSIVALGLAAARAESGAKANAAPAKIGPTSYPRRRPVTARTQAYFDKSSQYRIVSITAL